jgi:hypothetical protein
MTVGTIPYRAPLLRCGKAAIEAAAVRDHDGGMPAEIAGAAQRPGADTQNVAADTHVAEFAANASQLAT